MLPRSLKTLRMDQRRRQMLILVLNKSENMKLLNQVIRKILTDVRVGRN